jgi:hypothetical protein
MCEAAKIEDPKNCIEKGFIVKFAAYRAEVPLSREGEGKVRQR